MKKHLSIIFALAAFAVPSVCLSQVPTYAAQSVTVPATVAATVTTNLATKPIIDVRKQQNVTIAATLSVGGAGTTNIVIAFERSVDGNNWVAAPGWSLVATTSGTTQTTTTTNLNVGGVGYLRIATIANAYADQVLTNNAVYYSIKISAP